MSVLNRWALGGAAATLMVTFSAVAQETAPQIRQDRRENRREARQDARENAPANNNDATLVDILIPGNQAEIALGRLAEQKSQNQQVRQFAQQMVQAHTKFLNELRRFGGVSAGPAEPAEGANRNQVQENNAATAEQNAETTTTNPRREGVDVRAGNVEVRTPGLNNARESAGGLNLMHVMHQIHQRCLASSERYLQQKQGREFDDAYIGMNIDAHRVMLDKLAVLSEYASPQLQKVIQQGEQTTKQHWQEAEQLMKQLASHSTAPAETNNANQQQQ